MTHDELVALIRGGVPAPGGIWADFGAGRGNFTRALRELTGADATIYAIDRDKRALKTLQTRDPAQIIHADFTQPLDLPPLHGLLIANALHFIRQQHTLLDRLVGYLRPGGRLLIVEYDVTMPRGYIPFPVPFQRFHKLATAAGLTDVRRVGERRSPSSGVTMYAALSLNSVVQSPRTHIGQSQ